MATGLSRTNCNAGLFQWFQNSRILSAQAYRLYDYRFNDFSLEDEETLKVHLLTSYVKYSIAIARLSQYFTTKSFSIASILDGLDCMCARIESLISLDLSNGDGWHCQSEAGNSNNVKTYALFFCFGLVSLLTNERLVCGCSWNWTWSEGSTSSWVSCAVGCSASRRITAT